MFSFPFGSIKKRDKLLKPQIKVIKRNREITATEPPEPGESKWVEPSAREITIVIKNWIAESRQSKRSQNSSRYSSLLR